MPPPSRCRPQSAAPQQAPPPCRPQTPHAAAAAQPPPRAAQPPTQPCGPQTPPRAPRPAAARPSQCPRKWLRMDQGPPLRPHSRSLRAREARQCATRGERWAAQPRATQPRLRRGAPREGARPQRAERAPTLASEQCACARGEGAGARARQSRRARMKARQLSQRLLRCASMQSTRAARGQSEARACRAVRERVQTPRHVPRTRGSERRKAASPLLRGAGQSEPLVSLSATLAQRGTAAARAMPT